MSSHNSPTLPIAAFVLAVALGVVTVVSVLDARPQPALSELQIALVAWTAALSTCAVQGAVSIALEGRQTRLGRIEPRASTALHGSIGALSVLLIALSGLVAWAIASAQPTAFIGTTAGAGCIVLGLLLLFYKEACIGHEAHLDLREDGIPW